VRTCIYLCMHAYMRAHTSAHTFAAQCCLSNNVQVRAQNETNRMARYPVTWPGGPSFARTKPAQHLLLGGTQHISIFLEHLQLSGAPQKNQKGVFFAVF